MIRGYYLKFTPYMDEYDKEDILSDLDLLREDKKGIGEIVGKESTKKYSYFGRRLFYITLFKPGNDNKSEALYEIYSLLSKALPHFIKVFKLSSGIIVTAYPYFKDRVEDYIYTLLIDELLRITGFLLLNMKNSDIIDFLRDYVDINVFIEEEEENNDDNVDEEGEN